jgi:uncharacterized sodium:solute symporter family permease YidK
VLYSGALFMQEVFGVDRLFGGDQTMSLWVTVMALGVVGSIYAIFGGLKAVAVSDTLNGIGLLIGGLLIPYLGLVAIGDQLGDGGLASGLQYLTEHRPRMLNPIGRENENIPFSTLFTGMLFITTYYWCTNQAIVQRTFGSKSLAEGQRGVLFAAFMKLLGPVYLVLPGIIAFHMFSVYRTNGEEHVVHQLPTRPAIMATDADGRTSVFEQSADALVGDLGNASFDSLVSKIGQTISVGDAEYLLEQTVPANTVVSIVEGQPTLIPGGNPELLLPQTRADQGYGRLVMAVVPGWMQGFFAAVIFGAILSSFNSGLNSAATLFSVDIYKSLIRKDATEAQMVRTGKILGIVFALGAISVAPFIAHAKGGLFDFMKNLAALYNIPLLAVVLFGMFSRRTPPIAAWVGVITGMAFYGYFGLLSGNTIFGQTFNWLHIVGMNVLVVFGVMAVLTILKPRESNYVQNYTEDVDITPWKLAIPCGILILILVAVMYWSMSRFG